MPNGVPFTTFNFKVLLSFPNSLSQLAAAVSVDEMTICRGEFSEVDGIEMSMAPKTIREGGNNGRQIHLSGPVSYGQLTLKRGMTENTHCGDGSRPHSEGSICGPTARSSCWPLIGGRRRCASTSPDACR